MVAMVHADERLHGRRSDLVAGRIPLALHDDAVAVAIGSDKISPKVSCLANPPQLIAELAQYDGGGLLELSGSLREHQSQRVVVLKQLPFVLHACALVGGVCLFSRPLLSHIRLVCSLRLLVCALAADRIPDGEERHSRDRNQEDEKGERRTTIGAGWPTRPS